MRMSSLRPVAVATCTAATLVLGAFTTAARASAPERSGAAQNRPALQSDEHRHFADHDREVVQGWYEQHRAAPPAGLRDSDRLDAAVSAKITVGAVLDSDVRKNVHAVPADLLRQLPVAQQGDHYYLIDGQLCLVDKGYQVEDVIRLNGK